MSNFEYNLVCTILIFNFFSATLAALLKNEKGMADLCWTLLKALAHDYEDLSAELKGPKRGKNIEELIHRHLERSNKNVMMHTLIHA